MSFLNKIEAKTSEGIRQLIMSLYNSLGNKRYIHDFERILETRMSALTPAEEETLLLLARGLKELPLDSSEPRWKKW